MTRKLTPSVHACRRIAQFVTVLTGLMAMVGQSQVTDRGRLTGKSHAARMPGARALSVEGPGAPFFLPPVLYDPKGSGFVKVSVAIADVNGDGKPDLFVANRFACSGCSNGSVAVLLGNGDGTFQPAVTYDSGRPQTETLAVADVNGDGKPDLIVGGNSPQVGVLLGNGDGTFQTVMESPSLVGADKIVVSDMNGDGKPDVLVLDFCYGAHCNANDGAVAVLAGRGDGTFLLVNGAVYDSGGRQAESMAVADVNGDGKPDVVVANECNSGGCSQGNGVVGVLLGNGDGTVQPVVDYSGGDHPIDVAIADVNGDGKLDILEIDVGNGAGVLLGNGDGTFRQRVGYDTGGYTNGSIVVADINRDGKLDLVIGNNNSGTIAVLLGNADGTFQPAVTQAESDPRSLAVADLNGDGRLDLVVGTTDGNTKPLVGVMLHVGAVPTTTTVVSSPNPSTFGQSVSFTAMVTANSGTPKGTVIFYDGSTSLGSATLLNGSASISSSALEAGSRSISAVYQGSLKFATSISAPIQQVVNSATTTSALASSLNPALVKQSVTYTATVASQYGGAVTGTVMFQDGGSTVATVTMVGNQAAYTTSYGSPGTHSITATYSGDANNTGSVSSPLLEQINKGFPSKTALTSSGSPSLIGQPVTFTATVTSSRGPIPDGELVTFYDGMAAIGTSTTASSVATFTSSSLTAKKHTIKATYAGDAIFQASSGSVIQVVNKYPTTTTLTSSPNPSQSGQAVTFTAQVASAGPTPTGRVKFLDGATTLGSATLSGGAAKLTRSTLAVGTHPITAQYLGDDVSAKSTSPVVNQVVQ